MKIENTRVFYEVFDFIHFTRLLYPDYKAAKKAYDQLGFAELNKIWVKRPRSAQDFCNLFNHTAYELQRERLNSKDLPVPETAHPFFEEGCTCRPIPTAAGVFIGGVDDCPVHGFHEEE